MKDLNKFGVQEMNALEMKEVDGGFPWFPVILIGAGILWAAANFVKDVIIEGEDYDCTEW